MRSEKDIIDAIRNLEALKKAITDTYPGKDMDTVDFCERDIEVLRWVLGDGEG